MMQARLPFRRFLVLISLFIVAAVFISAYLSTAHVGRVLTDNYKHQMLDILTRETSVSMRLPLATQDREAVNAIVENILETDIVYGVIVKSPADEVIAVAFDKRNGETPTSSVSQREIRVEEQRNLSLDPFAEEQDTVLHHGTVTLFLTTDPIDEKINAALVTLATISAVVLVALLSVIVFTMRRFGQVQARLISALRGIQNDEPILIKERPVIQELNDMVQAVNALSAKSLDLQSSVEAASARQRLLDERIREELKEPLLVNRSLLDMMASRATQEAVADPMLRNHLQSIATSSREIYAALDRYLEYSANVSATTPKVTLNTIHSEVLFDQLYLDYRNRIDPNIEFTVAERRGSGPHPYWIRSDDYRLNQILRSLLNNCVQHTTRGSIQLEWSLTPASGSTLQLTVVVSDTGAGIEKEALPHVFKPFFKASNDHAGWGLGLAIGDQHCQALGGQLTLESTPDQGTQAQITLPVQIPDNNTEASAESDSTATLPLLKGLNIAIIDDNPNIGATIKEFLQRCDAKVRYYSRPHEALYALQQQPADAVLLDAVMPELDGAELAQAIVQQGHPTYIMCLSAQTSGPRYHHLEANSGAYGVIQQILEKPIELTQVATILTELRERKQNLDTFIHSKDD